MTDKTTTLSFANNEEGRAQKKLTLRRYAVQGWSVMTETLIHGDITGNSEGTISVTLQHDRPTVNRGLPDRPVSISDADPLTVRDTGAEDKGWPRYRPNAAVSGQPDSRGAKGSFENPDIEKTDSSPVQLDQDHQDPLDEDLGDGLQQSGDDIQTEQDQDNQDQREPELDEQQDGSNNDANQTDDDLDEDTERPYVGRRYSLHDERREYDEDEGGAEEDYESHGLRNFMILFVGIIFGAIVGMGAGYFLFSPSKAHTPTADTVAVKPKVVLPADIPAAQPADGSAPRRSATVPDKPMEMPAAKGNSLPAGSPQVVQPASATAARGTTTASNVNLRDQPTTRKSTIVGHLKKGTQVSILEQRRNKGEAYSWYHVKTSSGEGWVFGQYLKVDKK